MARLRRSDCSAPGIARVRRGEGFQYVDGEGVPVDEPEVLARISELVIPPAWRDVWICPYPMGHIQATGVDAAGRKQYLYHPTWREQRDRLKFDDMIAFARDLPKLRAGAQHSLERGDDLSFERVMAAAIRLLDYGFFRIGSEDYAVSNETYGLATMRKDHVRVDPGGLMSFEYPAKHQIRHDQGWVDPLAAEVILRLKRRRGGGDELLAYKVGRQWKDVRSSDINAFIKAQTGADHSAKDFRTWGATVLAAHALAQGHLGARSRTARKRVVVWAVKEVARYLNNTPAVCRSSYIDPRVIDAFEGGVVIKPAAEAAVEDMHPGLLVIHHPGVEAAVLDLITGHEAAPGIERVAA
jgi:DNA topoisomerase IB